MNDTGKSIYKLCIDSKVLRCHMKWPDISVKLVNNVDIIAAGHDHLCLCLAPCVFTLWTEGASLWQ
jgi:hypothetical protein